MKMLHNGGVRVPGGNLVQVAPTIQEEDAASSPIISPKTAVTTTPQAFKVPTGAVNFVFSTTAAGRYGVNATLDGSATLKGYKKCGGGVGVDYVIPCAAVTNVYVAAEAGTIDVDFYFEVFKE